MGGCLKFAGRHLGTVRYAPATGALTGDVACLTGRRAQLTATAEGSRLTQATVAGETFEATKVRANFGRLVAAFLIAVAAVILLARLFGMTRDADRRSRG